MTKAKLVADTVSNSCNEYHMSSYIGPPDSKFVATCIIQVAKLYL